MTPCSGMTAAGSKTNSITTSSTLPPARPTTADSTADANATPQIAASTRPGGPVPEFSALNSTFVSSTIRTGFRHRLVGEGLEPLTPRRACLRSHIDSRVSQKMV